MKRSKQTKKALTSSVLALVLCFVMLLGTTFAWFTDTASTGVSKIQAGTLEIVLEQWNGEKWVEVEKDEELSFIQAVDPNSNTSTDDGGEEVEPTSILWEPNCTYALPKLRVVNKGNLAVKFRVDVFAVTGDDGLADVLEIVGDKNGMTLADALKGDNDGVLYGKLGAGEATATTEDQGYTIALHMKETAGNEYQDKSIEGIQLVVRAAQDTVEFDSISDQYDAEATFDDYEYYDVVTTDTTTAEDVTKALTEGKSVWVSKDITISAGTYTLDKDVALGAPDDVTITLGIVKLAGNGSLTINGGKLETSTEVSVDGNCTLTINGGTHSFNAFFAVGNGKIVVNGGTLNLAGTYGNSNSVKFKGNGSLYVNGGTLNLDRPIDMGNNSCDNVYVEINGGTINMKGSKLFTTRNVLDEDASGTKRGSSVKITGGVFHTTKTLDSDGDANAFIRNEDKLNNGDTKRVMVDSDDYNCVVTGGTFYGCWARNDNYRLSNNESDKIENTIAGFVADGYQITGDATSGYVVSAR